jgi:hypothetical protein
MLQVPNKGMHLMLVRRVARYVVRLRLQEPHVACGCCTVRVPAIKETK